MAQKVKLRYGVIVALIVMTVYLVFVWYTVGSFIVHVLRSL